MDSTYQEMGQGASRKKLIARVFGQKKDGIDMIEYHVDSLDWENLSILFDIMNAYTSNTWTSIRRKKKRCQMMSRWELLSVPGNQESLIAAHQRKSDESVESKVCSALKGVDAAKILGTTEKQSYLLACTATWRLCWCCKSVMVSVFFLIIPVDTIKNQRV